MRTLRQACSQEIPGSAMCVQNFDDSRGLAIRITYRISLRSSSLWEPRHPLLKVVGIGCSGGVLPVHSLLPLHFRYCFPFWWCMGWFIVAGSGGLPMPTMAGMGTKTAGTPFAGLEILDRCGNDPSAGSPTETLLRLHLPLDDKV